MDSRPGDVGRGPRAVQYLILGAKARAALQGSYLVRIEDVEALAEPVLVHRILTSFHAEIEGITSRDIIKRLLAKADGCARVKAPNWSTQRPSPG